MADGAVGTLHCPSCLGEFRPGIAECPDCGIELVPGPPEEAPVPPPAYSLVPVLETGNPALLAVAESLLADAGIPFEKRGEGLQDLFGWGRVGTGWNVAMGPVVLQVRDPDAERALELLGELEDEPYRQWESLEEG